MSADDLFQKELEILAEAGQWINNPNHAENPLLPEYRALAKHYKKLLNQTKRLVTMSDRMQKDLNKLNHRLEELSSLDGLTGIPNRRWFDTNYEKEWRRALRSGTPLSVIMIDIDYFKRFNDTYGHAAGDNCLQQVAQAISSAAKRAFECVARYGGEEFVAVLPGAGLKEGQLVAENMRTFVEKLKIPHIKSETADYVTISVGLASLKLPPDQNENGQTLINAADNMLYKAKENGRNRVCHEE